MTMTFNTPPGDYRRAVYGDERMAPVEETTVGEELRELILVFVRSYRLILGVMAATIFLALVFIWITPPLYGAKVELLVDPRQKQTIDDEISPTGLGSSAAGADTLLLESQLEVIASRSVMERLMREENLTEDPEFVTSPSGPTAQSIKNVIKTVLFGPHEASWQSTSPHDKALKKLRKRLEIGRERNTYVIGISMMSVNAEKAARIANRVAEIYIENVNSAASESTREAAVNLESKLVQLREEAQRSAEDVERYKSEKGLIGAQQMLVVEQQLRDLNDQLSRARVEAQTALAVLNQVKGAGELGARLPSGEIGQSQVMSQLQTTLAGIEAQEAELSATNLPRHPRLVQLRERKAAIEASLRTEYERIVRRLQANYDSAVEKTESVSAEVTDLQRQMALSNADSVRLKELEREAEASRTVYETFLTRSKEAREQVDIPSSTARIISTAYSASKPSYPPVPLLLAGSVVFGLCAGFGIAWLRHLLRPVRREREQGRARPVPSLLERAG